MSVVYLSKLDFNLGWHVCDKLTADLKAKSMSLWLQLTGLGRQGGVKRKYVHTGGVQAQLVWMNQLLSWKISNMLIYLQKKYQTFSTWHPYFFIIFMCNPLWTVCILPEKWNIIPSIETKGQLEDWYQTCLIVVVRLWLIKESHTPRPLSSSNFTLAWREYGHIRSFCPSYMCTQYCTIFCLVGVLQNLSVDISSPLRFGLLKYVRELKCRQPFYACFEVCN